MADEARLEAHSLAFLLTSPAAFATATSEVARTLAGNTPSSVWKSSDSEVATGKLAASHDLHLRSRGYPFTPGAMKSCRDSIWFPSTATGSAVPLHTVVQGVLAEKLRLDGDKIAVDVAGGRGGGGNHSAHAWHILSLHLPPDLLVGTFCAHEGHLPPTDLPDRRHPNLEAWLERDGKPFASLHTHVAAGVPFHALWANLQWLLATGSSAAQLFPKDLDDDDKDELFAALLAGAVVRVALAQVYVEADLAPALRRMSAAAATPGAAESAARYLLRPQGPPVPQWRLQQWRQCLFTAYGHRHPASQPAAIPMTSRGYQPRVLKMRDRDPLALRAPGHLFPETWFAYRLVKTLIDGRASPHSDVAKLFWQATRARCRLYAQLVQRADQRGLSEFFRSFQRIKGVRGTTPMAMRAAETAIYAKRHCGTLESIELRTSPERSPRKLKQELDQLMAGLRHAHKGAAGVVIHFQKERVDEATKVLHGFPGYGGRFSRWHGARRQELGALTTLLGSNPRAVEDLRGFDVCSDETSVPFWAFRPVLKRARALGQEAAARRRLRSPGLTLHLGEDYPRLLTGLRAIGEPLRYGLLLEGDRIGHGLALGQDPALSSNTDACWQPREERLLDILWVLDEVLRGVSLPHLAIHRLEAEAVHHGRVLFADETISLDKLCTWRKRLNTINWLRPPPHRPRMAAFLMSHSVFRRAIEPIKVESLAVAAGDSEPALLEALQSALRREVARRGITVEVLPSSNLVVGGLMTLANHPYFRMQPVANGPVDGPVIDVAIGDDDPTTFGSSFGEEYANLFESMRSLGVAVPDALAWLERARAVGWRSRFTL